MHLRFEYLIGVRLHYRLERLPKFNNVQIVSFFLSFKMIKLTEVNRCKNYLPVIFMDFPT